MNIEMIAHRMDELQLLERTDPQAAASGADALRVETLAAIADGAADPQQLAIAAMRTVAKDVGGT